MRAPVVVADAAVDAGPPKKTFVHGAGRCGECHEKMYDEWEVSAHAQAATSSLYLATKALAKDETCDRCHAPLSPDVARDGLASEGVTCDVCHTLRDPKPSPEGASFRLAIDDMVKYGPRCDLDDHYFHRMGCSPEHAQAVVCGTCHLWKPAGLPVFTEYEDWLAGPAAKSGEPCQGCHMPDDKAPIANGSPVRTGVPHHGLLGRAGELRKRALELEVEAEAAGEGITVKLGLRNVNAGHTVPAGLPERRIGVAVRLVDAAGAELGAQRFFLGRQLVDDAGKPAPFWAAKRVVADTRIAPGATWTHDAAFPAATGATKIVVDVAWHGYAPELAMALGLTEIEQQPLLHAEVSRAQLPKRVVVRPPPPSKRPKGSRLSYPRPCSCGCSRSWSSCSARRSARSPWCSTARRAPASRASSRAAAT